MSDNDESSDNIDDTSDTDDDDDDDDDDLTISSEDINKTDESDDIGPLSAKIAVSDIRTAFQKYTKGKDETDIINFEKILNELNINLKEKKRRDYFMMLDENNNNLIAWNDMYKSINKGLQQFGENSLTWNELIGGILIEYYQTERYKKKQI